MDTARTEPHSAVEGNNSSSELHVTDRFRVQFHRGRFTFERMLDGHDRAAQVYQDFIDDCFTFGEELSSRVHIVVTVQYVATDSESNHYPAEVHGLAVQKLLESLIIGDEWLDDTDDIGLRVSAKMLLDTRPDDWQSRSDSPEETMEDKVPRIVDRSEVVKHAAENLAQVATGNNDDAYGRACDDFAVAAKQLATTMLEERIKRSFAGKVEDGRFTETHEEKLAHSRMIRDWCAPWNLALCGGDSSNSRAYHFSAVSGRGGLYSNYRLAPYGRATKEPVRTKDSDVWDLIRNPSLADVTDSVRRKDNFRSR